MGKNAYRFVDAGLFTAILLLSFGQGYGQKAVLISLAAGLSMCFFLSVWCQVKIRGRLVMALSALLALGFTVWLIGAGECVNFLRHLWSRGAEEGAVSAEYYLTQAGIQAVIFGVGCFLATLLIEEWLPLRMAVTAVLFSLLLQDLFTDRNVSHMVVVCILLYVLLTEIEWTQRVWKKQKNNEKRQYIIWILPFLALYFLLMTAMPAPKEPYDWRFVKKIYGAVKEEILKVSQNWSTAGREDFGRTRTGFSGEGTIFGDLARSDREVMEIQGSKQVEGNLYLIGKIYDTFDQDAWECVSESTAHDRRLDTLETMYAVSRHAGTAEREYMREATLQIKYLFFHTAFLFTPLKALTVTDDTFYTVEGGNLLFEDSRGYGTSYETSFMQYNMIHPDWIAFVEAQYPEDEAAFQKLQKECGMEEEQRYTLSDLAEHRDEIYAVYGQKVDVSPRVADWIGQVTQGADTDIERLKAIEGALQELEYTKTPGAAYNDVRGENQFLETFLLESRCGYCAHFATAFVLIARAEGYPARYVEGFCVPVQREQKTVVTSDMAHAWPEVYVIGVGWIPFEPTPGYQQARYTGWELWQNQRNENQIVPEEEAYDMAENPGGSEEPGPEELLSQETEKGEQGRRNLVRIVCVTFLFAVLIAGVILLTDRLIRRRKIARFSLQEKFLWEAGKAMRILALLGYPRAENETLEELEKRAWALTEGESEESEEEQQPALCFFRYYEEILYGLHPVSREMLDKMMEEKRYLLRCLKKWKPIRYLYVRLME